MPQLIVSEKKIVIFSESGQVEKHYHFTGCLNGIVFVIDIEVYRGDVVARLSNTRRRYGRLGWRGSMPLFSTTSLLR